VSGPFDFADSSPAPRDIEGERRKRKRRKKTREAAYLAIAIFLGLVGFCFLWFLNGLAKHHERQIDRDRKQSDELTDKLIEAQRRR